MKVSEAILCSGQLKQDLCPYTLTYPAQISCAHCWRYPLSQHIAPVLVVTMVDQESKKRHDVGRREAITAFQLITMLPPRQAIPPKKYGTARVILLHSAWNKYIPPAKVFFRRFPYRKRKIAESGRHRGPISPATARIPHWSIGMPARNRGGRPTLSQGLDREVVFTIHQRGHVSEC